MEREILDFWKRIGSFETLVENNRDKDTFSFIDGPITANNPMGAHHAWGRTYKDIFQRYQAMHGKDQRYQNGFDCQGLWVEVGGREGSWSGLQTRNRALRSRQVLGSMPRPRR